MELKKPSATSMVLVLILLVSPCWSTDEVELKAGEEIDQIDYRGPETHSFIPPPRSKFGPQKSSITLLDPTSKALQPAAHLGRKGNGILAKP
uniref:Uncharacterized protein n=1 Tax=Kalanchoe fedtschenkoi TaxID=63787 RepID=A0A7N0VDS9_KALFE